MLDPFIADMETAGLLTEYVVPTIVPLSWNREEGVFLPSAQIILNDAFQTAAQLGHAYVDCEHLLYAVLKQSSPEEGKVLPLFEMLHLSPEELARAVKADLEQLPSEETPSNQHWHHQTELVRDKVEATQPEDHPKLTRDAAEAIRRACRYVPERGQCNVSAYHLAHGICRYLLDESFRQDIYRQHYW